MSLTDYVIMPGTDYQAICDSVRAKTGGTEVLKSGEIASAIDGISGGGSSLPKGIYTEPLLQFPNKSIGCLFVFSEDLYLYQQPSSGKASIYKYSELEWSIIVENIDVSTTRLDCIYTKIIEYHGYAHFIGEYGAHAVWDGITFTILTASAPGSYYNNTVQIYKDELYLLNYNGILYKWNENEDSYIEVLDTNVKYGAKLFTDETNLYICMTKTVYKIVNNSVVSIVTLPKGIEGDYSTCSNGKIFIATTNIHVAGTSYTYHELINDTLIKLGDITTFGTYSLAICYNDHIHVRGGNHDYRKHIRVHIVSE